MSVAMQPVTSGHIAAVGYEPESSTLHIAYKTGKTYQHAGVPAAKFDALLAAPSVGQYVNANIKTQHPHTPQ